MAVEKICLEGKYVRLEPMAKHHHDSLCEAVSDGELWKLDFTLVSHPKDMSLFIETAEEACLAGRELPFVIIERANEKVAGSTRFMNINMSQKRIEIGFTFLGKSWQRTAMNTETKLLLLLQVFEKWHLNRVQFLTDVRNERSREAILRLGAKQEGVLRSHMVMRDGRIRDSVLFSITSSEWPGIRANLRRSVV